MSIRLLIARSQLAVDFLADEWISTTFLALIVAGSWQSERPPQGSGRIRSPGWRTYPEEAASTGKRT